MVNILVVIHSSSKLILFVLLYNNKIGDYWGIDSYVINMRFIIMCATCFTRNSLLWNKTHKKVGVSSIFTVVPLVRLFVYFARVIFCHFSLPPGVRVWLQPVVAALPLVQCSRLRFSCICSFILHTLLFVIFHFLLVSGVGCGTPWSFLFTLLLNDIIV